MSLLSGPQQVKPIGKLICSQGLTLEEALAQLIVCFGEPELISRPFPVTGYRYDEEMGKGLSCRFITFTPLIPGEELVRMKQTAVALEQRFTDASGRRRLHIDVGYMSLENFVLATGVNHPHSIPLGSGVFAQMALAYEDGSYRPLPWTDPSYSQNQVIRFLNRVRERYRLQLLESE